MVKVESISHCHGFARCFDQVPVVIGAIGNLPSVQPVVPGTFPHGAVILAEERFAGDLWRRVAAWTHRLPTNPTDHWMDRVRGAVRGQYHRWQNHHFLTDGWTVAQTEGLDLVDFYKHLGCDLITKTGIPMLPASVIEIIHETTGLSLAVLKRWTHLNILDLTAGVLSNVGGISLIIHSAKGHLPWSAWTFLLTFGVGTVDIAAGISSNNPLLVAAGIEHYAAGTISAWRYYSQPFLWGVPLNQVMRMTAWGAAFSGGFALLSIAANWNKMSIQEKISLFTENVVVGGMLSFAAAFSPWISIPLSCAYSGFKLVEEMCAEDRQNARKYRLISRYSFEQLCGNTGDRYVTWEEKEQVAKLRRETRNRKAWRKRTPAFTSPFVLEYLGIKTEGKVKSDEGENHQESH